MLREQRLVTSPSERYPALAVTSAHILPGRVDPWATPQALGYSKYVNSPLSSDELSGPGHLVFPDAVPSC